MNKLILGLLLSSGLLLPVIATASPDDDVTIRVMEMDEHSGSDITRHIELPDSAAEHAREAAEHGTNTASRSHDNEREAERDVEHENEREMERESDEREMEHENEREMERESDDREVERDDNNNSGHRGSSE